MAAPCTATQCTAAAAVAQVESQSTALAEAAEQLSAQRSTVAELTQQLQAAQGASAMLAEEREAHARTQRQAGSHRQAAAEGLEEGLRNAAARHGQTLASAQATHATEREALEAAQREATEAAAQVGPSSPSSSAIVLGVPIRGCEKYHALLIRVWCQETAIGSLTTRFRVTQAALSQLEIVILEVESCLCDTVGWLGPR